MAQDESASSERAARAAAPLVGPPAVSTPAALSRLAPALMFVAPLLLALATYWPRLGDFFALDDFVWLLAVQDRSLPEVIGRGFTFPEFTAFDAPTPFFRPLTDTVFKLEEMAFGLRPGPYHVVNLALHVAVAGMGGVLTARLSRSVVAGVAVAAVFAVFPAYDVAVTWISQLSELLGAFFCLLALLAYHAWLTHDDHRRARWYFAAALAAAALAALSKESQVTVFVLLPLLAVAAPGRRRLMRDVLVSLGPLAALAATHGGFLIANEYLDAADNQTHEVGWHMFGNGWRYLRELAFPFARDTSRHDAIARAFAIGYLCLGAYAVLRGWRAAAFFFVWSLLALAPFAIGLGPVQPRYTYLAALPFIGCVGTAALQVMRALPARRQTGVAAGVAAAFVVLVVAGARETRDRQRGIEVQARRYDLMVAAVRAKCGELPPGSSVSIINAGVIDPYGVIVPAAINVYYDRVRASVRPPGEPAPAGACAVDVLRDVPAR